MYPQVRYSLKGFRLANQSCIPTVCFLSQLVYVAKKLSKCISFCKFNRCCQRIILLKGLFWPPCLLWLLNWVKWLAQFNIQFQSECRSPVQNIHSATYDLSLETSLRFSCLLSLLLFYHWWNVVEWKKGGEKLFKCFFTSAEVEIINLALVLVTKKAVVRHRNVAFTSSWCNF